MGPGGASRRATEAQAYGSGVQIAKPRGDGQPSAFSDDPDDLPPERLPAGYRRPTGVRSKLRPRPMRRAVRDLAERGIR